MSAEKSSFHSFLSEFRTLSSTLSSQLSRIPGESALTSQRAALADAELSAESLSSLLSTIEPDLRHFPYSLRIKAQSQFEDCQSQFDAQQATLQRYQQSIHSGRAVPSTNPRAELLGSTTKGGPNGDQRQLLLSSRAVLQEGDSSLDHTQRMLAEAAATGAATSTKLVEQREQFDGQIEDLEDANYSLRQSKRTLRSMALRVFTNKLLSAAIVLSLILIFILIAWLKYWKLQ